MRITVVHSSLRQQLAEDLSRQLALFSNLSTTWIVTSGDSFGEDLKEVEDSEDPLLLIVDESLVAGQNTPARVHWSALLRRIESGGFSGIGLIQDTNKAVPPLLSKCRVADPVHPFRSVSTWLVDWIHGKPRMESVPATVDTAFLLEELVDQAGIAYRSCLCANTRIHAGDEIARLLKPYFEEVHCLHASHSSKALRDFELGRIQPGGRNLWILVTDAEELPELPERASMLVIHSSRGKQIEPKTYEDQPVDPITRALELIPKIPNEEGRSLPFTTLELEGLLKRLFQQNWLLAERMARRAGVFFKLNQRVAEAIWVYETLKWQATLQAQVQCAQYCEEELHWLHARGTRGVRLKNATQPSLF